MDGLNFLYRTAAGRCVLKFLASRAVSRICGAFMDSPLSSFLIKGFVRKNNINCNDYELDGIKTFNQFFRRRIKDGKRPFDMNPDHLCAPCDGLLSAYPINDEGTVIPIKQSAYTTASLLKDKEHTYQGLEDIMVMFGENCPCPMGGYGGGFHTWLFFPERLYSFDDRYGKAPYESKTGRHPYGSWGNGSGPFLYLADRNDS